ncbi:MAG: hypothetical protein FD123_1626 [Bacteroidetes bacterium]|nr:MAG: hypothetical protein FD123_1626 [Bacteroidota bacterium]
MRNIIPVLFAVFTAGSSFAQGLLNNGAFIVMNGAASNIYIDGATGHYTAQGSARIDALSVGPTITLEGNWVNNSNNIGFGFDGSEVVFAGANQSIGGSQFTHFYDVTLAGSGTKTMNIQTRVGGFGGVPSGVLSVGSRILNMNGYDLWHFNPLNTAITYTTGYIQSETNVALNPSTVRWFVGANTGSYVIPFGVAATQIPLTTNITAGMSTAFDYFAVSTRATSTSANTPWASGVTHMYDPNLAQDGSDEAVIDRWWEYTFNQAATATVTFSYRGSENTMTAPYNTGNIGAQYWSSAWLPNNSNIGSAAAVGVGVGSVTAAGLSFAAATYTPWVLSSLAAPLPVTFLDFSAACSGNEVLVNWKTASETNNDYFVVERSSDGAHFSAIGNTDSQAPGGNSTGTLSYTFTDAAPLNTTAYYRIRQVDFNGDDGHSGLVPVEPCSGAGSTVDVFGTGSDIEVMINAVFAGDYNVAVYDMRGRIISERTVNAAEGINRTRLNLNYPESAMYMVRVFSAAGEFTAKRVYVSKFD